jgi:hypothetical protein
MHQIKLRTLILFLIVSIALPGLSQDNKAALAGTVYYFIDADCEKCQVQGQNNSRIWVTTEKILVGKWEDRQILIEEFKDKLSKKLNAAPILLEHIVFRFQDTEEETRKSFSAKENKMKAKGYAIIKIDFHSESK